MITLTDEQWDVLRRIAERGLEQAQIAVFTIHEDWDKARADNYSKQVDAWQHMLDELLRIKANHDAFKPEPQQWTLTLEQTLDREVIPSQELLKKIDDDVIEEIKKKLPHDYTGWHPDD